jgi:hypothetical protein
MPAVKENSLAADLRIPSQPGQGSVFLPEGRLVPDCGSTNCLLAAADEFRELPN